MDPRILHNRLRNSANLWLLLLALCIAYLPSLIQLWRKWILWDQSLAHGLPTIALVIWLLLRLDYKPTPNPRGRAFWLLTIALGCCSLIWYLCQSLSMALPADLLLLISLALLLGASLGLSCLIRLAPYLGLLIFAIPLWDELTPLLVHLSSLVVGQLVKISQLTAMLDGTSIFLPWGTIFIADGCSGLRYLCISLLLANLIILLNQYRWRPALLTFALAVGLGLAANWLRIYLLVLIGYHTQMQSSLMQNHETFGWLVFMLIMFPAIYFAPVKRPRLQPVALDKPLHWQPLLALALGPALLLISQSSPPQPSPLSLSYLNKYSSGLESFNYLLAPANLTQQSDTIQLGQLTIRVDLFGHTPTRAEPKIVPYFSGLVDKSQWYKTVEYTLGRKDNSFSLNQYRRVGGNKQLLIALQYRVGGFTLGSYAQAKLAQIPARLYNQNYFGLLALQIVCTDDCSQERDQLNSYLEQLALPQKH